MGTVTEPVEGSGAWPAWIARVEKPRSFGSPFTVASMAPPVNVARQRAVDGASEILARNRKGINIGRHDDHPRDILTDSLG